MMDKHARVGVDVGGTFTDIALQHGGTITTTKVLTDYAEPERAIVQGIRIAMRQADISPEALGQIVHGTTLVTNALIERRGARVAFVTTQGFRDVVEMRTESRFEQYDLDLQLPRPLVERPHRFTLEERVSARGEVLVPLVRAEAERLAHDIVAAGYQAVAVGFLHAYANDSHERMVAEILAGLAPSLPVSLSSVVSPRMREFERFNTVIANAYVQPLVADYLRRLVARLSGEGIDAPVSIMHSGGGLIDLETAIEQPVRLLESGPAGGAIFAAGFARAYGLDRVLSFDMGGTTAKVCLIDDKAPTTASVFEVARTYRFKKGSGMTVSTPVVEMIEIGAGGGSIASVDAMGRVQVGPRSAGSEPGPACYQRGGTEPTVTDANLLLGRLDPDNFAGGAISLSSESATAAMNRALCGPTGLSVADAAFAITEIVDENMANAARVHLVESGRDSRSYTMVAFGGAAPLHACRLCEKLGIERLVIPSGAGVGSAIGFLNAPRSHEAVRSLFQRLDTLNVEAVNAALGSMEEEARGFVSSDDEVTVSLTLSMRYAGQGWEIPVGFPFRMLRADDVAAIRAAFDRAYGEFFGRTIDGMAIEITTWALVIATALPDAPSTPLMGSGNAAAAGRSRTIFDAALRRNVSAAEIERSDLKPGMAVDGPAAITERETTTIVTSSFRATAQGDGSILIESKGIAR